MDKEKKSSDLDLYNRYGDKIWLHYINNEGNNLVYSLEGNLDFARLIYRDTAMTIIDVIDPSGGPYMSVNNFTIKENTFVLDKIVETTSGDNNASSGKFLMYFKPNVI